MKSVYSAVRTGYLNALLYDFDPRIVHQIFGDEVALGQVFLPVLTFSPFIIIPPLLDAHLHVVLNRRTNLRSLGTFHKITAPKEMLKRCIQMKFHLVL